MKIAVVVPSFPTISETFILNHITGLIDDGHDVTVFSFQKSKAPAKHGIIEKYNLLKKTKYIRVPSSNKHARRVYSAILALLYGLRFPRKMFRVLHDLLFINRDEFYQRLFSVFLLTSEPQDIYHFHFGHIGRLGAFLKASGFPIKMVTSFHGYDVNKLPRKKNENFYQELFDYGDHFIANTEFTKQQVVNLGCNSNKISVIPVGLHVRDFPFSAKSLGDNEIVQILTVGRLVEKKGLWFSIQAIAQLINEGFNIHYTIAGDGPLRAQLEGLVNDLKISEQVTFRGEVSQEQVIDLYEKSHLFVLSSVTAADGDKEGQGLVIQEAQACGLPVVSTLHNGIPDGMLDGQSGILVPEKDVQALAAAIGKLIQSVDKWPQIGRSGRSFVEERFDSKRLNERLMGIYKQVLQNKS